MKIRHGRLKWLLHRSCDHGSLSYHSNLQYHNMFRKSCHARPYQHASISHVERKSFEKEYHERHYEDWNVGAAPVFLREPDCLSIEELCYRIGRRYGVPVRTNYRALAPKSRARSYTLGRRGDPLLVASVRGWVGEWGVDEWVGPGSTSRKVRCVLWCISTIQ